jgi:hypothetical protein
MTTRQKNNKAVRLGKSRGDSKSQRAENIVVFIDTMIFLHFRLFDQIDWPTVLNADHVTIVIPPITIRELDKHKNTHAFKTLRERAQTVSRRLLEVFSDGEHATVRRGVDVRFEAAKPNLDFDAHRLDSNWQDDYLLATILCFKRDRPESNIVIVTNDTNLILKSRQYGLQTFRLPDDFKLQDVLDASERKVKELEKTIQELRSRSPILRLGFEDGSDHIKLTLIKPSVPSAEEMDQTVEQLKKQYSKMAVPPQVTVDTTQRKKGVTVSELAKLLEVVGGYTVEEKHRYNVELDQFFSGYRSYLEKMVKYLDVQARTIPLAIFVHNDGTAPGEDIDIHLHFPDGFNLVSSEVRQPKKPKVPKAQSTIERVQENLRAPYMNSAAFLSRGIGVDRPSEAPNVSGPTIRRTKSYDVNFRIGRLKHNMLIRLDRLFCVFDSFEAAQSLGIQYEINAGNVAHQEQSMLHVIVERELEKS